MCGCHFIHLLGHLAAQPGDHASLVSENRWGMDVHGERRPKCLACGSAVAPEFTWCPRCGVALKAHACAYCGQLIGVRDKTCGYCGGPASKIR